MNTFEGILYGLQAAVSPELLIAALVGTLIGTFVGVMPGMGPIAGAAVVLPISFLFEPAVGLIIIMSVYLGSQFGGSISSVLLNIPGDAQSVVATFDGYPMAQKGKAGPAVAIMIIGSFIAGILGLIVLLITIPLVAPLALQFRTAELFALTAGGLIALSRIAGGSLGSGLLPMFIGLAIATIGTEPTAGTDRFTFGSIDLTLGISLATVALGIYGVTEALYMVQGKNSHGWKGKIRVRDLRPSKKEVKTALFPWIRGSFLGYGFGLLPGPSATLSTFASYKIEQSIARDKTKFGKGAVQGLAGPEAANSSATVGSLLPVLILGLPFSATLALMLAAMTVQGIQPGPLFASQHPEVFWAVIGSVFIANLILVVLNVPLLGVWVRVLKIPAYILAPIILVLCSIGAYTVHNNLLDMRAMIILGLVGYILRLFGFSLASLLLGVVLGPLIEQYFVEGLAISQGDLTFFFSSPIAIAVWCLVILVLVGGPLRALLTGKSRRLRPLRAKYDSKPESIKVDSKQII